ncbi:MAG: ATP-binding protein, partial [Firmicutes bacterium]|nr:ATP-binding protein [Bacillota bacterium]
VIEPSGRLANPETTGQKLPPQLKARLRPGKGGYSFILADSSEGYRAREVLLTQPDIRELQLAKGALYAGLQVLLQEAGLQVGDLDQVLLAGAFGNYIRRESAREIGLLPSIPLEKITAVGNAAGRGARMALISRSERARALALPDLVEHVELSARADFQEAFIKALAFEAK